MDQLLQIAGAICILTGFMLSQAQRLNADGYPYLFLNLIGSSILTFLAFEERQWGFLLLEGVWAVVALASIIWHWSRNNPATKPDAATPDQ
jgi:hypothetical protein